MEKPLLHETSLIDGAYLLDHGIGAEQLSDAPPTGLTHFPGK